MSEASSSLKVPGVPDWVPAWLSDTIETARQDAANARPNLENSVPPQIPRITETNDELGLGGFERIEKEIIVTPSPDRTVKRELGGVALLVRTPVQHEVRPEPDLAERLR